MIFLLTIVLAVTVLAVLSLRGAMSRVIYHHNQLAESYNELLADLREKGVINDAQH